MRDMSTTTRHELTMTTPGGGETIVWFTPVGETVRIYTWAAHTDYTTTFTETLCAGREAWKSLVARGFKFTRTFTSEDRAPERDAD
jgi:hypothetical protein